MQYKSFKDSIKLSRLGMGNMRLPMKPGTKTDEVDYKKAKKIIDHAMKDGINYYDTAYVYHGGDSERFLGWALKDYQRESFYVADKFNFGANPDYKEQFRQQLERLQMDYIDFYLLHAVMDNNMNDYLTCGCLEYFDEMKKQGKIKYLGFSYHGDPKKLQKMVDAYDWDFVQIQLNYYDWYFGDAKDEYETLTKAGIPVMVMEPVHGGLLADLHENANKILKDAMPEKSIASWALRWVMSLDNVQVILSGMSTEEQEIDNGNTFAEGKILSKEEQELVEKACRTLRSDIHVACTGCRYCCPECPMGLDIPMLLSTLNKAKVSGAWVLNHLKTLSKEQLPSACISCGSCMNHCPQSFQIPKYMKELAAMMDN